MNCKLRGLLLGFFSFAFAIVVSAQNSGDAQVRLSLAQGKTVYRSGEPVRLILSFTANTDGYMLDSYLHKPTSSLDELLLSPDTGAFEWAKPYKRGTHFSEHVSSLSKLSAAPTTLELALNDFVRFDKPGKYSLRVKTKRVSTGDYAEKNWSQIALTTNEITFETKEMSEADEEREVKRLSTLLDVKRDWQTEAKIAEELS